MRPQKFDPRGDYRRQEIQRTEASVYLSEKFRELKSLTVELAYFNPDGARRNGEMKCTFDPDKNKSVVRFDCCNHECVGGDFDLSEVLAQAVAERRTTVTGEMCCQGWLSKTTIDEIHCHHILRYKLRIAYRKTQACGKCPIAARFDSGGHKFRTLDRHGARGCAAAGDSLCQSATRRQTGETDGVGLNRNPVAQSGRRHFPGQFEQSQIRRVVCSQRVDGKMI